jgi:NADH dehydrogenase FAD-containing subunit
VKNKFQVVLVDQSVRFVFKPMLYELLSGGNCSSSEQLLQLVCNFLPLSHDLKFSTVV